MKFYIGVDVGISGAIAALNASTREISFWDMPVVVTKSGPKFKNAMDPHAVAGILIGIRDESDGELLMVIEKQSAMPGWKNDPDRPGERVQAAMGVTSAFNFGAGYGTWIGLCVGLQLPYQLVHPATWKSALMKDMGKEKDASRVKAMQLYPYTAKDLARKKDHARGDALLLAHYGMTVGTGQAPAKVRRPVVQNAPHEAPLLFGGSSVQMPRQRVVEEEADPLGEF